MVSLMSLVSYLHESLQVEAFRDYAPNGLQVEGRAEVRRLASGVTASRAVVEAAIAAGADALLVHHGYFWQGEDARIVGMKKRRVGLLLAHDVSLLAYHLPLDAHAQFGNNVQLAQRLGIAVSGRFGPDPALVMHGELPQPLSPDGLARLLAERLGRAPLHIRVGDAAIRSVGWCTGAAQKYLEAAAAQGLDAYISGEVSESTVHAARELGIHYFAAGHHATERYGVQALGAHLAEKFSLEHFFVEEDNPV